MNQIRGQLKDYAEQMGDLQAGLEHLYKEAEPSAVRLKLVGARKFLAWAQTELNDAIVYAEQAEKVRRKKQRGEA